VSGTLSEQDVVGWKKVLELLLVLQILVLLVLL
jgi:hypothetical protein